MGQPTVRLANVFRDGPSQRQIRRAEIYIKRNQGRSCSNHHGPGRLVEVRRTKIRCPVRIGGHPEGKALKPSSTYRLERGMIAGQGRSFVEKYRDLQLCSYSPPYSLR